MIYEGLTRLSIQDDLIYIFFAPNSGLRLACPKEFSI